MSEITPASYKTRSSVYRKLTGATYTEFAGAAIAESLIHGSNGATRSGLLDLSVLPRIGYRGNNVPMHLQAAGLPVPAKANQAQAAASGELVLRLSNREFWILGALRDQGATIDTLRLDDVAQKGDCFPLYCRDSHACFALTGAERCKIMAKLCGVDLREKAFGLGAIAQTSVARINAIVVHYTVNNIPTFYLLCDSAAAEYLWECLLDAMAEFHGEVIGLAALSS